MSYTNESCHIRMSHITNERVMSHMKKSCHGWMNHVTYGWVTSHLNKSRHIYEWVMSHMNESCHIWMNHVTYERVMPHMNKSCHKYEGVTLIYEWTRCNTCGIWGSIQSISTGTYVWRNPATLKWSDPVTNTKESLSHVNESGHTCDIWGGLQGMGWLWLVGSLKL